MRAAVVRGPCDIELEQVEDPRIGPEDILVKVRACGICGTDVHTYRLGTDVHARGGDAAAPARGPVLGHEFSGEVVELGASVRDLKVGDRVAGTGVRSCGECRQCRQGRPERCSEPSIPGYGMDGAFADYVVVPNPMPGTMLFRLPDDLDWAEAAMIEPAAVAAFVVEQAGIQPRDTVVVLGAGTIGQLIGLICRVEGAATVVVSEPSRARASVAASLGADAVINPAERNAVEAVAEATSGRMASVVFECSGSPDAFRQGPAMLRPFGRMLQVGIFERAVELTPELTSLITFKNLTLRGCAGQRWERGFELVQSGRLRTAELVTHRFPLEKVREAFETQAGSADAIKVQVNP